MIVISEEKYWKKLNYHDGLLYCQLLNTDGNNDWRLIKDWDEWYHKIYISKTVLDSKFYDMWYDIDAGYHELNQLRWVVPVRDV